MASTANLTSPDGTLAVTVTVLNNDSDGVYAVQVTAPSPAGLELAIDVGSERIWQGISTAESQG